MSVEERLQHGAEYDPRTQSWLDTLKNGELAAAKRVLAMPGGNMATAFLAVEMYRLRAGLSFKMPTAAGGIVGAALTLAATVVARTYGV